MKFWLSSDFKNERFSCHFGSRKLTKTQTWQIYNQVTFKKDSLDRENCMSSTLNDLLPYATILELVKIKSTTF